MNTIPTVIYCPNCNEKTIAFLSLEIKDYSNESEYKNSCDHCEHDYKTITTINYEIKSL